MYARYACRSHLKEDSMSKRFSLISTAACIALLLLIPAVARGAAQISPQDQKFLKEAAAGGMEEVKLGQLAVQKAANTDVKSFGQRMVDDHSKANDRLKQLAAQKGVALSSALPPDMKNDIDRLTKLSGAAFDKMYMSMMVKDHKKDVSEFEKETSKADDANVKSFAQQTLPTLREHLQMAESVASKVGAHPDHTGRR